MDIINYIEHNDQPRLLEQIAGADWTAAGFLARLLKENRFPDTLGGWGKLFLLMDGDTLAAFATLTGQDSVRDEALTPWIGFVYTKPEYRGRRFVEHLLRHAEQQAAAMGYSRIYIGTGHVGLYEKFGYTYLENRTDCWGEDTRILCRDLPCL